MIGREKKNKTKNETGNGAERKPHADHGWDFARRKAASFVFANFCALAAFRKPRVPADSIIVSEKAKSSWFMDGSKMDQVLVSNL